LFFTKGCKNIKFDRSAFIIEGNMRQQINELTSFLDGSMVYGSDKFRADALRTFSNGKLKTSSNGLNLPFNVGGLPNAGSSTAGNFFLAGDIRVNEQIGLIAIHTLFVREHNRLADLIGNHYPDASDGEIYELARKLVGAEIQKITYAEWLPALLGPLAPKLETFSGYNEAVDPRIASEFTTAAFRLGHTMLSGTLRATLLPDTTSGAQFLLKSVFFNPSMFANEYFTDMMIGGLLQQKMQEVDNCVIDDVRQFLFGNPSSAGCLDLVTLNIQR
jgi:peroxidase